METTNFRNSYRILLNRVSDGRYLYHHHVNITSDATRYYKYLMRLQERWKTPQTTTTDNYTITQITSPNMSSDKIPTVGHRTTLAPSLSSFLKDNPSLHLGGDVDFHSERRHHLEVFGRHNLPEDKRAPIGKVEFSAVRGPHGTIPIRLFYPQSVVDGKKTDAAALIYFHGGGYTVGSVDEFENGLRILAEEADAVVSSPNLDSRT